LSWIPGYGNEAADAAARVAWCYRFGLQDWLLSVCFDRMEEDWEDIQGRISDAFALYVLLAYLDEVIIT
jgi:hypothetical protein